jgi:hypothetical protein
MSESSVRDRIIEEATKTLDMSGPEPWAAEAGLKLGPNDKPSWCGLWARSMWRRAGLTVPDWKRSQGNVSYLTMVALPRAQHGDLVCWKGKEGHQSLFVRTEGPWVITLDANTIQYGDGGKILKTHTICQRKRPHHQVLAVFRAPIPGES